MVLLQTITSTEILLFKNHSKEQNQILTLENAPISISPYQQEEYISLAFPERVPPLLLSIATNYSPWAPTDPKIIWPISRQDLVHIWTTTTKKPTWKHSLYSDWRVYTIIVVINGSHSSWFVTLVEQLCGWDLCDQTHMSILQTSEPGSSHIQVEKEMPLMWD